MANLYEIDYQLRVLEDYMCDPDTGELLDEDSFNAKFDEIQMALSEKIENSMCFYKNLQSDIEAFKIEGLRKLSQFIIFFITKLNTSFKICLLYILYNEHIQLKSNNILQALSTIFSVT